KLPRTIARNRRLAIRRPSSARQPRALQRGHMLLQSRPEIAMRSARQQAHAAELAQVPGRSARDETLAVARHVVAAGEHFQKGHAIEHLADTVQPGTDL